MSNRNNAQHGFAAALLAAPPLLSMALISLGLLTAVTCVSPLPAVAQEARSSSEFNRPFGMGYGEETRPIDGSTRDQNGNRVIVNGRRAGGLFNESSGVFEERAGVGYGAFGQGPSATATAIGNNLTVITQGSYNTVIVNSVQENNGDQSVELELKGSVDD